MVEKLRPGEDIGDLPRIMRAEIGHARTALARVDTCPIDSVHAARKAIKRARSSARLLRAADRQASRRINAAGRRAARVLAEARDADSLEHIVRDMAVQGLGETAIRALRAEAERAREDGARIDQAAAAKQACHALDDMEREISAFVRPDAPQAALARGLARTYRRARQRLTAAQAEPSGDRLHALRKCVKDWRYQVAALKPVWPGGVKRRKSKAGSLARQLGEYGDLDRLIRRLEGRAGPDAAAAIAALADRREAIASQALELAETVFHRKPKRVKKALKGALLADSTAG